MNKIATVLLSAVIAITAMPGSAFARDNHRNRDRDHNNDRNRYVTSYCSEHPRARDCRDWRRNGRNWNDNNYRGFYERNYRNNNNNDAALAAIFGFVAGAAIAGSTQSRDRDNYASDNGSRHQRACAAKYRSYDARTDSFMGRDGRRYYCEL